MCQGKDPILWAQRHATMERRYGAKTPMQSAQLQKRIKKTNRERFGSDWYTGTDAWREQNQATLRARYGDGIVNMSQIPGVHEKKVASYLATLGVENPSQSDQIKLLKIGTLLRNYGVTNPTKSADIYRRIYDTNMKLYGFRMRLQNPSEWAKHRRVLFSTKRHHVGGRVLELQGYEPDCIDWMLSMGFKESWFDVCSESFPYTGGSYYHPDFIIETKHARWYVEVKSTFTAGIRRGAIHSRSVMQTVCLKSKAVAQTGRNIITVVLGDNAIPMHAIIGAPTPNKLVASDLSAVEEVLKSLKGK